MNESIEHRKNQDEETKKCKLVEEYDSLINRIESLEKKVEKLERENGYASMFTPLR